MIEMLFATHNPNKLAEVQQLLPDHIKLLSLRDMGCKADIPETATTLKGNAKLKADFGLATYHLPCFADDTGLLVTALNGAPGVHSARYAGPQNNAEANMAKLLRALGDKEDRRAKFQTVIALNMNGQTLYFKGEVQGSIRKEKSGSGGFGYDPIFEPQGYDITFAEMPLDTKNSIGHRGKAFSKLIAHLGSLPAVK
ncbi:non-canonical purine NTP diphosphatase [Maribacter sp. 2307ULW6-5]|uniref:non-canonical purine NTP diphosphatase n=1 Tax=Maribacter sp. 2307ULW6-5 TaxID=3386275 RepID=UPI0039BC73F7